MSRPEIAVLKPFVKYHLLAVVLTGGATLLISPRPAMCEEGGSGHYLPGSMASFMDGVPPAETFIVRLNVLNYEGSIDAKQPLPIAGLSAVGVDASSWGYGLTALWRPPLDLGERWSYAMSATLPLVEMKVSATLDVPLPGSGSRGVRRSDSLSGLGDLVLMPVMFNYKVNADFNVNARLAAYAPTGDYEVGRLANTGKNFWTIEPTLALMYLGQQNGIEASLFMGVDFNQENPDTHYKSGTQFHLDGTLAQHFPLSEGLAGIGVSSFYYEQITGDSGSGASFGDFKAKTAGIGPVVSYARKLGGQDLMVELKWLHEYDTQNRLEGDTVFLKALIKF
jgi:hypothetical protein